jgi:hypothetical protein
MHHTTTELHCHRLQCTSQKHTMLIMTASECVRSLLAYPVAPTRLVIYRPQQSRSLTFWPVLVQLRIVTLALPISPLASIKRATISRIRVRGATSSASPRRLARYPFLPQQASAPRGAAQPARRFRAALPIRERHGSRCASKVCSSRPSRLRATRATTRSRSRCARRTTEPRAASGLGPRSRTRSGDT